MSEPHKKIDQVGIGVNHNIESVVIGGLELVAPWGIETADSWAFFTQEWGGYRHQILEQCGVKGDGFNRAEFLVKMREGKWRLKIDEQWGQNTIRRRHELTCLEDSWFMDFVSRYVFKSSVFPYAEISGHTIKHRNEYRNHQYPVRSARLFGGEVDASIDVLDARYPDKFKQLMYVRGTKDAWVVHVRLFPATCDRKIVKRVKGVKMATPLPWPISRLLLALPPVYRKIWHAGDRGDWSWPIHGLGLVLLKKGEVIRLSSSATFAAGESLRTREAL